MNKHRLNSCPEDLKVGMKVTSDFYEEESNVIRKIISINEYDSCQSKLVVVADGGEPCKCCGRFGRVISGSSGYGVDASWFIPVEDNLSEDKDIEMEIESRR